MPGLRLYADSYGHDPQPDVAIRRGALMNADGTERIGTTEVWTINGTLTGSTIAEIKTKVTALESAYSSPAKLELREDATVREQVLGANARDGLVVDGPHYPEGNNAEYVTKRRYTIVVTGEVYDGGYLGDPEILWFEEFTTVTYDENDIWTREIRGRLKTKDGVSAAGKYATIVPAVLPGSNRVRIMTEVNDDDDEMAYSFTDVEYWVAWPSGVTTGSRTTTRRIGQNGANYVSITGRYTGSGAQAAADAEKLSEPRYRTVEEEQSADPYDGSVSFRYEYYDLTGSTFAIVSWIETVTFEYGGQDFVILEALDGEVPERQETVVRPYRATQSGSAVGMSAFPAYPPLLWDSAHVKPPKRETKSGPELLANGEYGNYRVTWDYNFEFAEAPTFHDPNVL